MHQHTHMEEPTDVCKHIDATKAHGSCPENSTGQASRQRAGFHVTTVEGAPLQLRQGAEGWVLGEWAEGGKSHRAEWNSKTLAGTQHAQQFDSTGIFWGGSHCTVCRHLRSIMRDQTWAPCSGSSVLTTGQPGSSLYWDFLRKDSVGVGVTFGDVGGAGRGWAEVG